MGSDVTPPFTKVHQGAGKGVTADQGLQSFRENPSASYVSAAANLNMVCASLLIRAYLFNVQEKQCNDPHMAAEKVKSSKTEKARQSPCGPTCPDFVTKTCPGEDPKCALFWRFSEGLG